jgi:membrane associated rhomboid family serine protease
MVTHHYYLWQLVTYIFLHDTGNWTHILFNMLGLWMFGSDLEQVWGSREFTKYFFICGVGAGILTVALSPNSPVSTIGASGAIYGILLAYALLFPNRIIYWIIFPIKAWVLAAIFFGIAFLSSISVNGGGVAHIAHLGGGLFGFLYLKGRVLPSGLKWRYERWQRARLRKKFDVYYNERHRDDDDNERWRRWK